MKLARIFFVVLIAFAMFAWVAQEDVRDSEVSFSACEMLPAPEHPAVGRHVLPVVQGGAGPRYYASQSPALAGVSSTSLTKLSSCILRC